MNDLLNRWLSTIHFGDRATDRIYLASAEFVILYVADISHRDTDVNRIGLILGAKITKYDLAEPHSSISFGF